MLPKPPASKDWEANAMPEPLKAPTVDSFLYGSISIALDEG